MTELRPGFALLLAASSKCVCECECEGLVSFIFSVTFHLILN